MPLCRYTIYHISRWRSHRIFTRNFEATIDRGRKSIKSPPAVSRWSFQPVYESEEGDYCLPFAEMAAAYVLHSVPLAWIPARSLESCASTYKQLFSRKPMARSAYAAISQTNPPPWGFSFFARPYHHHFSRLHTITARRHCLAFFSCVRGFT